MSEQTLLDAIRWFKTSFKTQINAAVAGTPFTLDLLTAVAMQETYFIWGNLYKKTPDPAAVLKLCVGDTLDAPKRSAFPKNKAELLSKPKGKEMFDIARQALVDLGTVNSRYAEIAQMNPNKFCHGFGIFQYDLQFFTTDPGYFLGKKWESFPDCLAHAIQELKAAKTRAYGKNKPTLTRKEMVYVAIAYNRGSVNTAGSFKQGYKDESGKYYGEHIDTYLTLAAKV